MIFKIFYVIVAVSIVFSILKSKTKTANKQDNTPANSNDQSIKKTNNGIDLLIASIIRTDQFGPRPYRKLALIFATIATGTLALGILTSIAITCHPELVFLGMYTVLAILATSVLLTAVTFLVFLKKPRLKQIWLQRVILISVFFWLTVFIILIFGVIYLEWQFPWFQNIQ